MNLAHIKSTGLTGNKHLTENSFISIQFGFGIRKPPVTQCFNSQEITKWGNDEFFQMLARFLLTKTIRKTRKKKERFMMLLSFYFPFISDCVMKWSNINDNNVLLWLCVSFALCDIPNFSIRVFRTESVVFVRVLASTCWLSCLWKHIFWHIFS